MECYKNNSFKTEIMISHDSVSQAWKKALQSVDVESRYMRCLKSADVSVTKDNRVWISVRNKKKKDWIKENVLDILQNKLNDSLDEKPVSIDVLTDDEMEIMRMLYQDDTNSLPKKKVYRDADNRPVQSCWFCDNPSESTILVEMKLDKRDYLRMIHKYGSSKVQIPICNKCKQLNVHHSVFESNKRPKHDVLATILVLVICLAIGVFVLFYFDLGVTTLGRVLFGLMLGIGLMVLFFWILSLIDDIRHPDAVKRREEFIAQIEKHPEIKRLIDKDYEIYDIS